MNSTSSRSHAVFTIILTQRKKSADANDEENKGLVRGGWEQRHLLIGIEDIAG